MLSVEEHCLVLPDVSAEDLIIFLRCLFAADTAGWDDRLMERLAAVGRAIGVAADGITNYRPELPGCVNNGAGVLADLDGRAMLPGAADRSRVARLGECLGDDRRRARSIVNRQWLACQETLGTLPGEGANRLCPLALLQEAQGLQGQVVVTLAQQRPARRGEAVHQARSTAPGCRCWAVGRTIGRLDQVVLDEERESSTHAGRCMTESIGEFGCRCRPVEEHAGDALRSF